MVINTRKTGYIYIMANKPYGTLYVGVTSNLKQRVHQHQLGVDSSAFVQKYKLNHLVYYEQFNTLPEAIAREKQLKAGSRQQKLELIQALNPKWEDLYQQFNQ